METTAKYKGISLDYTTGETLITFASNIKPELAESEMRELENKPCTLTYKAQSKKRSKDANALLWASLQELANVQKPPVDKWVLYLEMLKKYGQYTFIMCAPEAVESIKQQWRETQVVGEVEINGYSQVQLICFFGSSTYTVKEFSILLDGIFMEMEQEGLTIPTEKEKWEALERWSAIEKKN